MLEKTENMEIACWIWEHMASQAGSPHHAKALAAHFGVGLDVALIALGMLKKRGLIEEREGKAYFKKKLEPLSWAQAVQMGISLKALESLVTLEAPEEASELLLNGNLEKQQERQRKIRAEAREKVLRGHAASKAAASEIAKIVRDTKMAKTLAPEWQRFMSKEALDLIGQAEKQAEEALLSLEKSLMVESKKMAHSISEAAIEQAIEEIGQKDNEQSKAGASKNAAAISTAKKKVKKAVVQKKPAPKVKKTIKLPSKASKASKTAKKADRKPSSSKPVKSKKK